MALLKASGQFYLRKNFDIFGDDVQYQSPSGQGEEGILVVQNAENGVICRESKNSLDFLKKHSRPPATWMATDDNGGMGRAIGVIERWKDSGNRLRPGMVNFLKCYQFSCKKGKYIGDVNDLLKEDTPGEGTTNGAGRAKEDNIKLFKEMKSQKAILEKMGSAVKKIEVKVAEILVEKDIGLKTPSVNRSTHARVCGVNKERFSAQDSDFARLFSENSKDGITASIPVKELHPHMIQYHQKKASDPQKPYPAGGTIPETPEELLRRYSAIEQEEDDL